jgi:hypothetical protein
VHELKKILNTLRIEKIAKGLYMYIRPKLKNKFYSDVWAKGTWDYFGLSIARRLGWK